MTPIGKAIHDAVRLAGYPAQENTSIHMILLDPEFWKSLGKVKGWSMDSDMTEESYFFKWYQFIRHLDEGKTATSFFETL